MANFEAPSFSLGLDFDPLDPEPQITCSIQNVHHSSSNQFSVKDEDFETLVVDDSDLDYPDPHPKLNRLLRTGNRKQNVSNALEPVAAVSSCNNPELPKLNVGCHRRFQVIDSDSDTDYPSVNDGVNNNNMKCYGSESYSYSNQGQFGFSQSVQTNRSSHVTIDLDDTLPPAHRYFFHDDITIQELVRSRLCNFSLLGDVSNNDHEQCSQSKIDYMGQFSCGESSKQNAGNITGKKSSTRRKFSRKSKTDESSSPGWVNPKFGVDKVTTKGVAKRKVHAANQSPGQWLTGSDGKKVYVGKNGQELTGRVAYMCYKKENGAVFKKSKRKFFYKKK